MFRVLFYEVKNLLKICGLAKHLEYIVIAVTALIFTFYHAILSSLIIARFDFLDYTFAYIFVVEIIAFIPMAVGMFAVMWAGKKWPSLFTSLTYPNLLKHTGFALLLFLIHALWQPLVNAYSFNEKLEVLNFTSDFISFFEMRFLVYVIIVGLVSGLIKLREQQLFTAKESILNLKLQKARLKEFELKMNPEIIYPNLGFIREKATTSPEEASQMVILMAGILRRLVDNIDKEKVRLSEEAAFFSMYTDLIKLRLETTSTVTISLEQELEKEKVPSMILIIPFFEELFFGKYAPIVKNFSEITFTAKKLTDHIISEVITIRGVLETQNLANALAKESLIDWINFQLQTLVKGNFAFKTQVKRDELILALETDNRLFELDYEK